MICRSSAILHTFVSWPKSEICVLLRLNHVYSASKSVIRVTSAARSPRNICPGRGSDCHESSAARPPVTGLALAPMREQLQQSHDQVVTLLQQVERSRRFGPRGGSRRVGQIPRVEPSRRYRGLMDRCEVFWGNFFRDGLPRRRCLHALSRFCITGTTPPR